MIQGPSNASFTPLNDFNELSSFASQNYPSILKQQHTKNVEQAIADAPPPKVLALIPLDISSSGESLPRRTRRTLAQVRL